MTTLPRGRIKAAPEDFVVEEIPAYLPGGAGDHLFVRFTKRGLTTDDAARSIASAAGVSLRDVGVAGLKDKVGVTTQTVSLPAPRGVAAADFDAKVAALSLPGVVVHEARRHGNKLKTGHLVGNRFRVVVRGVDPAETAGVVAALAKLGDEGLPNAYGAQRFGRDNRNAEHALAWLTGKASAPRDPKKKRFLWSALQSELFNEVLARRVAAGTWRTPLLGDVLRKNESGGLFDCDDVDRDRARAEQGEVSPTGPMFGVKMRAPTGEPLELETSVFDGRLGPSFDLASTRLFGEGARRSLCLRIEGLSVERIVKREDEGAAAGQEYGDGLVVCFVLPKGAYATTVLGAVLALDDTGQGPAHESSQAHETPDEERSAERAETETDD